MEVKYQIFVSSTYEDLKEERSVVMETILKLEQIPTTIRLVDVLGIQPRNRPSRCISC